MFGFDLNVNLFWFTKSLTISIPVYLMLVSKILLIQAQSPQGASKIFLISFSLKNFLNSIIKLFVWIEFAADPGPEYDWFKSSFWLLFQWFDL